MRQTWRCYIKNSLQILNIIKKNKKTVIYKQKKNLTKTGEQNLFIYKKSSNKAIKSKT